MVVVGLVGLGGMKWGRVVAYVAHGESKVREVVSMRFTIDGLVRVV